MSENNREPQSVMHWYCPNCGQIYFGDNPPDMCDFCRDFTTWKPLPKPDQSLRTNPQDDDDTTQLPLF